MPKDGFIDYGFDSFDAVRDFGAADSGYLLLPDVDLQYLLLLHFMIMEKVSFCYSQSLPKRIGTALVESGTEKGLEKLIMELDLLHLTTFQQS